MEKQNMKRHLSFLGTLGAIVIGATVGMLAQLPGPPVGVPQSTQSSAHGYNFGYTFTPNNADGSAVRINSTLNALNGTGLTQDLLRVQGVFLIGPTGITVTTYSGIHAVAPTITNTNSDTVTNAANLLVDAAPSGASNNYSAWFKGAIRADSTILTNSGGNTVTLPTVTAGVATGLSCGNALAAAGTCGNTAQAGTFKVLVGTYVLASNTSAVTGVSPAFSSSTSYNCVANDVTTRANVVQALPVSGSAFTITNTTGATDTISVICAGN